jgi:hypothetical protein
MLRNLFPLFQFHFYVSEIIFGLFVLFFCKNYKVNCWQWFHCNFLKNTKLEFCENLLKNKFFLLNSVSNL